MEIIQAKPSDLIEILYLLKVCILDMNQKGFKHWNSAYPSPDTIHQNLENGAIFLAKEKGVCKAMVTLNEEEPEDYKPLDLRSGNIKPLYLQHMAVHPRWQGMGIAKLLVDFAQKFAREREFNCIRLDVFKPSDHARQLYENQAFKEVASFQSAYQQIPFICYEKQL